MTGELDVSTAPRQGAPRPRGRRRAKAALTVVDQLYDMRFVLVTAPGHASLAVAIASPGNYDDCPPSEDVDGNSVTGFLDYLAGTSGFDHVAGLSVPDLVGQPDHPRWVADLDGSERRLVVRDFATQLYRRSLGPLPAGWLTAVRRRRQLTLLLLERQPTQWGPRMLDRSCRRGLVLGTSIPADVMAGDR